MFVLSFVCKSLKKGTCPCCEGSEVGLLLGAPKDQQECYCGKFVEEIPRKRGIPKFHTCIRRLGDAGQMFVTQDEKDTIRIDIRMKEPFDPESSYKAIRYLEERHPGTVWRFEDEGGGTVMMPQVEAMRPPVVGVPPPSVEEAATTEKLEPRPQDVKPEDLLQQLSYRGPLPPGAKS